MALISLSKRTMRYLLPQMEVTGKQPVWSVENFPVSSTGLRKTL